MGSQTALHLPTKILIFPDISKSALTSARSKTGKDVRANRGPRRGVYMGIGRQAPAYSHVNSSPTSIMIDWFVSILREYPPLALFLTIGIGFLAGRIRIGSF